MTKGAGDESGSIANKRGWGAQLGDKERDQRISKATMCVVCVYAFRGRGQDG